MRYESSPSSPHKSVQGRIHSDGNSFLCLSNECRRFPGGPFFSTSYSGLIILVETASSSLSGSNPTVWKHHSLHLIAQCCTCSAGKLAIPIGVHSLVVDTVPELATDFFLSRHICTLALVSWCIEIWSPCPKGSSFLLRQICNTLLSMRHDSSIQSSVASSFIVLVSSRCCCTSTCSLGARDPRAAFQCCSTALCQSLHPRPFLLCSEIR